MPTIYKANSDRISIADAKRLILEAVPREKALDVLVRVDEHGNIDSDGSIDCLEVPSANIYAAFIDGDFAETCRRLGIQPRMKYRPVLTDYTGADSQDYIYTIAHDEFVRIAELFSVAVATGASSSTQADSEPPAVPVEADAVDFVMLATRQQLINAFGTFSGMDASWFDHLKDTPALMRARKVTGQGGRGRIAEPLFCPFEVMQWLADPKRRKGRQMMKETAWRMLENHFPKVYAQHSIGDPRHD